MTLIIPSRRRAFTLLELQVAIVLLTFGVVTLASLMATQSRLAGRLEKGFAPSGRIYLSQSSDPWVRKLQMTARMTTDEPTAEPAPTVVKLQQVDIVSREHELSSEALRATVDITPVP